MTKLTAIAPKMAGHYSDRHLHRVLSFLVFRAGRAQSQDINAEKGHGFPSTGMSNTVSLLANPQ
jgi:hypothetical protein